MINEGQHGQPVIVHSIDGFKSYCTAVVPRVLVVRSAAALRQWSG
jgi:hypothetical protein